LPTTIKLLGKKVTTHISPHTHTHTRTTTHQNTAHPFQKHHSTSAASSRHASTTSSSLQSQPPTARSMLTMCVGCTLATLQHYPWERAQMRTAHVMRDRRLTNQQIIPEVRDPRIFPPRAGSAPLVKRHRATPECHLPNCSSQPVRNTAQSSRLHHSTWRRPQEVPCLGLASGKSRELSVVPFRAPRSRGTRKWMRSHLQSSRCAANGLGRE